ncbi:hypothetical protein [Synechococcus sp. MIT S9504]|uniref:hypothetical protein n=1 Tax=Synechococcus sp. MIT S9504 TaxID=1801628 RepID=UPI0007BBDBFA|nr:hypothetical protein [Synechococcus sp. MIT S9504]KZR84539.1 hypothetical protein MITS9504_02900 [Synechococcus sp. MIT S9504]
MKSGIFKIRHSSSPPIQEQGMAMVMALLMGTVLLAGTSGLMIRQMMARKLGAAESYNQLAESAALNGLNRIISDLNKDDRDNYTGFLLTLRNDSQQWGWANPNAPATDTSPSTQLVELCTPVERFINAYPRGTSEEPEIIPINTSNIRADGVDGDIEVGYRLRSYNTTATSGNGEGSFYVEGIVKRGDTLLSRALLKRALYVNSRVVGAGDWAVISGHNLRLNNTSIDGPGYIFYLTKSPDNYSADQYSASCFDSLLADVGATNPDLSGADSDNQIWPINIDETKRGISGLPPANLFEKDRINDTTSDSDGDTIRIWSFDDSPPAPGDRDGDDLNDIDPLTGEEILYPPLPCGEVICVRDADQTNASDFRTLSEEGINLDQSGGKIKLTKNILCNNSNNFDCHVHLDHVRLSSTKLHFEPSESGAIVLHLDQPVSYPNNLNLNQAIHLSGSAELCAATSNNCSTKPEQLVIMAASGEAPATNACYRTAQSVVFTGETLPYALLYLPTGIVRPNNATLTGLVWASSICVVKDEDALADEDTSTPSFDLTTEQNGISVVQSANTHWGWTERFNYPGYGRKVTRAIRGTSLDVFERW